MVIVDEKQFMIPPPPYLQVTAGFVGCPPPPFPHHRQSLTFAALPSHLLLEIVYLTFPQSSGIDGERIERQRKTLYWLSLHLRLVNRALYVACMHVLRSTYLPAYDSLIRPPYTSDPFPFSTTSSSYTSRVVSSSTSTPPLTPASSSVNISNSVPTAQRETQVLDYFIALKVREDVWMDDSELHLERDESFKDLFDLMQPRSRLEDLVRHYGVREGVVITAGSPSISSRRGGIKPLPFSDLTVSFSPRSVGLVLMSAGRKRTIVQVARTRDEKLEYAAKRLIRELTTWLASSSSSSMGWR